MKDSTVLEKAGLYLRTLCSVQPHRRVGSPGNQAATEFFAGALQPWGYDVDATPFACLDHVGGVPALTCQGRSFDLQLSPYSLGCDVAGTLAVATTVEELTTCDCAGQLLLLRGPICAEQLMPKNFVFYNPDHHKRIYALLEEKRPAAIITATEKKPELVGAIYPFPLIEDGDFDLPSVYCTETVGAEIAACVGKTLRLTVEGRRIPSTACNVIARKQLTAKRKIVVSAHIDARESTPGASDNASGVVVLLLLAEMLAHYDGRTGVEIVAFNGEDHYSVGGQMDYLRRYGQDLASMAVGINIDDVGYVRGRMAYSLYARTSAVTRKVRAAFGRHAGLMEGPVWYQGDHMIFAQNGRPAVAITAERAMELMRTVTHTARDVPELIDCRKLVKLASALRDLIEGW